MRAAVVEHHLHLSLTDKNAVVMQMMNVPAFYLTGTDGELADVNHGCCERRPERGVNLTHCSAIIDMSDGRPDDYAIDKPRQRLPIYCYGLLVLLRTGGGHCFLLQTSKFPIVRYVPARRVRSGRRRNERRVHGKPPQMHPGNVQRFF